MSSESAQPWLGFVSTIISWGDFDVVYVGMILIWLSLGFRVSRGDRMLGWLELIRNSDRPWLEIPNLIACIVFWPVSEMISQTFFWWSMHSEKRTAARSADDPLIDICKGFPVQHTPHEYAQRIRSGSARVGGRIVYDEEI